MNKLTLNILKPNLSLTFKRFLAAKPGGALGGRIGGGGSKLI
jgi:hypothetical protein